MQNHLLPRSERLETLKRLRDFFNAHTSQSLKEAYDAFSLEHSIDEDELEILFNRYFVGPMEPIADPFASVYIDDPQSVMTQSTLHVRSLYETMGFFYPLKNIVPEDHIGVELDAYYQLIYLEEVKNVAYLSELRYYFFHEHIAVWMPQLIERAMHGRSEGDNAIHFILNELKSFLIRETTTTRSHE